MFDEFSKLGLALAVGLLIGLERGWRKREDTEGSRIAGLRTFALFGLLGGIWGMLSENSDTLSLGLGFLGVAILLGMIYMANLKVGGDRGMTTLVAAMITFTLGLLCARGYLFLAAASAVVTAIVLNLKSWLHQGLVRLDASEIQAILKLLLISLVMLPVLPDQGYGPWQFFNPWHFWLMVVLIACISFSGYFAIKLMGVHKGVVLTSLLAGLVSSTALTLYLSRISRQSHLPELLAGGILIASATMFPRVYLEVAVVNISLIRLLWLPLAGMALFAGLYVFAVWRRVKKDGESLAFQPRNPFELAVAIRFSLLLVVIMLASMATRHYWGDTGIYILAGLSGVLDVDAITLSLARMTTDTLQQEVAARAIIIAVVVNTFTKAILAAALGDRRMRRYLLPGMTLTGLTGIVLISVSV